MIYEAGHLHEHQRGVWRTIGKLLLALQLPFSLAVGILGILHSGFV